MRVIIVPRSLKNRVKKLEEKAAPEEFEEIRIVNYTLPGVYPMGETVIRYPKKKKKRT